MPKLLPKYVHEDLDRHGNVRTYFLRKGGPKIRMRERQGTEEFMLRYYELLRLSDAGKLKREPRRGELPAIKTWRWLAEEWMRAPNSPFRRLDPKTQQERRWTLEATYDEPINPKLKHTFGNMPIDRMGTQAVEVLRDRKAETPTAANQRIAVIRAVYKWAVRNKLAHVNPAVEAERLEYKSDGFHTWTADELKRFRDYWPIGTKPRLALELMIVSGCRRSDVVLLGRQHVRNGRIAWTCYKNRNRTPSRVDMKMPPDLQAVIDASPVGTLTFIENERGRPFTAGGFGNRFKEWCREAGLPHCTAHGIRKAAACELAVKGATVNQLMATFGWKTAKEAMVYTRAADNARMADQALSLRDGGESGTKVSHFQDRRTGVGK